MPRPARMAVADLAYHVLNRAMARRRCFMTRRTTPPSVCWERRRTGGDADRRLVPHGEPLPSRLWPPEDDTLSQWMQWLTTTHVRRHHRRHGTGGHVWQGRFGLSDPARRASATVMRYVERNPVRAGLVARAEDGAGRASPTRRPRMCRPGALQCPCGATGGRWSRAPSRRRSSRRSAGASIGARPSAARAGCRSPPGGSASNRP